MQVNDMLEYRDKIIDAFKDGTFSSEYLKETDDAGYKYVLKDVKDFIQEIKSISEKISLSLFEEFFESSSPADYVKMLINTSPDENKKIVQEIQDKILDLKDRIKKISKTEKKNKSADETLEIIKKILDYNKNTPDYIQLASKADKKDSEPKTEESISERVKLKNNKIAEIKKEEKNINNLLFKYYFTNYQNPSDIYIKLHKTKGKINEDQVYSIKEVLNKIKEKIKNMPENKVPIIEGKDN